MIADPGKALREVLKTELAVAVAEDEGISDKVAWGPHVYAPSTRQAWHILTSVPMSDAWATRMRKAVNAVKNLRLGVAAPLEVLRDPKVLELADELNCAVLPAKQTTTGYRSLGLRGSICDVVYEQRIVLAPDLACTMLDRNFARAQAAVGSYKKGALLELAVALMLSQVKGFEVTHKNISSRNQEIDINVVNRNNAGPLGRGALVLAEAKNWKAPVPRKEYNAFGSKLRSKHGMAKLGVLVTSGTFEEGVYVEGIRESERDDVIVLLDKKRFPRIWRDHDDITAGLEAAVNSALYDHEP